MLCTLQKYMKKTCDGSSDIFDLYYTYQPMLCFQLHVPRGSSNS